MRAIEVTEHGGPEVLRYVDTPRALPRLRRGLDQIRALGGNRAQLTVHLLCGVRRLHW